MKRITPDEYVEGVYSIYDEMPDYETGGDGSDNKCDCIGMGRGALERKGVENVTGMKGTNHALRHTFQNVQKIKSEKQLRKGDIVLKTRDKDDKSMRLPDQYRKGGSDYSKTWGETNCTHYGSVTKEYPNLEITHMTSPKPKKDYSLGNWTLFGQLPWIDYSGETQDEPQTEWVRVYAENGKPVKMRQKPSITCRTWWEVPCGAEVILEEPGDTWSKITWAGRTGYMKTKFLRAEDITTTITYTVTVSGVTGAVAKEIVSKYGGTIEEE